ncbi:MAG: 2-dehydropantoate 2-reductase [candidate division KSB1 bacterium]|nr:2-dehydropantoate 2-reductase [candidate division KSB1 bacterium]
MKIVIVGAGAVGGIIAGYLSNSNYSIQLVCKHREILEAIENNGLRIDGVREQLICYPSTVMDISQIADKPDFVLLATKAYDVKEACVSLLPILKEDTAVVSLQNGICEDTIAEIVRPQRTIGCVVGWGATMLGPGRLDLTSEGEFIIGELDGQITHRLLLLRSVLEKIFPVRISTNIYGALYSKLIINSCITTLGAISGLYLGELLNLKIARTIFLHIFSEAVAVANVLQFKLEKIAGRIDPYEFALTPRELTNRFSFSLMKKHLLIWLIGRKYRRLKSSSLQSLERGKPTEIDVLNGYILKKARQYNIPVPVNQRLVALVKNIEMGKNKIERENLLKVLS